MLTVRLKKLRGNKTQNEIAKLAGVSRSIYSHYENGIREPNIDTLKKLADIHNVSVDYLLGRTNIKIPIDQIDNPEIIKEYGDSKLKLWIEEIEEDGIDNNELEALKEMWNIFKNRHK